MTDMDEAIVLWLLKPPYAYTANLFPLTRRAVHITEVTKSHLQGDFICQTADADEIAQDEVLNGLTTYLIWPKDQVRPANRLNISTEVGNYHVAQWNCGLGLLRYCHTASAFNATMQSLLPTCIKLA